MTRTTRAPEFSPYPGREPISWPSAFWQAAEEFLGPSESLDAMIFPFPDRFVFALGKERESSPDEKTLSRAVAPWPTVEAFPSPTELVPERLDPNLPDWISSWPAERSLLSLPAEKLKLPKLKIVPGTKETMLELMAAIELVEGLILATSPTWRANCRTGNTYGVGRRILS